MNGGPFKNSIEKLVKMSQKTFTRCVFLHFRHLPERFTKRTTVSSIQHTLLRKVAYLFYVVRVSPRGENTQGCCKKFARSTSSSKIEGIPAGQIAAGWLRLDRAAEPSRASHCPAVCACWRTIALGSENSTKTHLVSHYTGVRASGGTRSVLQYLLVGVVSDPLPMT